MKYFLLWVLCASLLDFVLMGVDKWKARHDRWRVPERAFFCVALLGGTPGALLGMWTFRHKTRHWYFRYGLPALLLVQLALGTWIVVRVFDLRCTGKAAPPNGGAAFFHGFFPSLCLVPSGSTI